MNWTHLPEGGGLYDQRPGLIDKFMVIFQAQAAEVRAKEAKEAAKKNNNMSRRSVRGR